MVRGTVLVVDDDRRLVAAISRIVRRLGFGVEGFAHASSAIAWVKSAPIAPHAAILDVILDGGHYGSEVFDALHSRFGAAVASCFMSGYSSVALRDDLPITLAKPVDVASLENFLRNAAALSALRSHSPIRDVVLGLATRYHLTPQEARLVSLLASGVPRKGLAQKAGIPANTVKTQVRKLVAKLSVSCAEQVAQIVLDTLNQGVG